jgi:hypothetical protein
MQRMAPEEPNVYGISEKQCELRRSGIKVSDAAPWSSSLLQSRDQLPRVKLWIVITSSDGSTGFGRCV